MQKQKPFKRRFPQQLKEPARRIIIGLTGSFGSGKSTVASIFRSSGAVIIDADRIAHAVIRPGNPAYRRIKKEFGSGILKEDKTIDRRKLALVVFGRKPLVSKLNALVHPQVIRGIGQRIKKARKGIVVIDAPLLFEAGMEKVADVLIVVNASQENQIQRIQKKSSLTRSAILKRTRSQIPLRQKVRRADFVIDNNGTVKETRKQVARIRRQLWRS